MHVPEKHKYVPRGSLVISCVLEKKKKRENGRKERKWEETPEIEQFAARVSNSERHANWVPNSVRRACWDPNSEIPRSQGGSHCLALSSVEQRVRDNVLRVKMEERMEWLIDFLIDGLDHSFCMYKRGKVVYSWRNMPFRGWSFHVTSNLLVTS